MVAADPSKWEYTICQLLAGLWSPDTICTEEKGNPVISCVKSDSPNGANCTPGRYLIGRKTSCISGSMAPFILPGLLCSGECLLLSGCFVMTVILVFLFLLLTRFSFHLADMELLVQAKLSPSSHLFGPLIQPLGCSEAWDKLVLFCGHSWTQFFRTAFGNLLCSRHSLGILQNAQNLHVRAKKKLHSSLALRSLSKWTAWWN